ncbi:uncharacterized protein LOC142982947 [Anticarsia gemmatalis]|uniref:uncharacterized protein LOC142982947 n=1 Tax=Anticarsia gemmatalis TaxID=129554 RepID=UPI003F75BCC5
MMILILYLLFFKVYVVYSLRSHARVAEKVWREHCGRNSLALNDCNWCKCDEKLQFACTARVCDDVDMFGHFNDAIREMEVGMEGHGYWRSLSTACEAGVYYRKDELLCVCNEDGKWPNPVCRDTFQVLHSVEATKYEAPDNQSCKPTKLYQVGCNICYCPSAEKLTPEYCTQRKCEDDVSTPKDQKRNDVLDEVYAECERAKKYKIGCKTCICLPNNRLLCDNCTSVDEGTAKIRAIKPNSLCSGRQPGELFKKDCNTCHCDKKDVIYCTVKKCLEDNTKLSLPKIDYEAVDAPVDDNDCVPKTKYTRDCNICHCFMLDGVKYFGCTLKNCDAAKTTKSSNETCVVGTKYEKNCLICHCVKEKGVTQELCTFNDECKLGNKAVPFGDSQTLDMLHGYCEPLHIYNQDCNKCRCLTDGKTVGCTSKICPKKLVQAKPVVVEIIPFIQKHNDCPKGHKYKVDCNVCQCMSNGNAICTTNQCNPNLVKSFDDY